MSLNNELPEKGKGKFKRLRSTAVPSRNLPKRSLDFSPTKEQIFKQIRSETRATRRNLIHNYPTENELQ